MRTIARWLQLQLLQGLCLGRAEPRSGRPVPADDYRPQLLRLAEGARGEDVGLSGSGLSVGICRYVSVRVGWGWLAVVA